MPSQTERQRRAMPLVALPAETRLRLESLERENVLAAEIGALDVQEAVANG